MTIPTKQPSAEMIAAWEKEAEKHANFYTDEWCKRQIAFYNNETRIMQTHFIPGYLAAKAADHAEMEKLKGIEQRCLIYLGNLESLQQENERLRSQLEKAENLLLTFQNMERHKRIAPEIEISVSQYFQSKAEKETK